MADNEKSMKRYWFVFHKGDIMLQKCGEDTYTIPCQEEPPTTTDGDTRILRVTAMADGTDRKSVV